ncbi:NADP-dependent oxidoreductase [Glycomyces buryatensis]|uniref:NADP-dependent oxidoreductase n=1 Tax=Glycomyces buryatensis TaxID=2570927 RepID=A0A4S8QMV4_9ACTN|nr:NADP-dependent oxidoreductase [Glycomyces buryatensis]THV42769.1 NADP-dependent oxidoreductase [Glycomyces buryatensis]
MRAITIAGFHAEPELTERPVPEPGPGEVLVNLAAAGVNPFDIKLVDGALRAVVDHPFPIVLGSDGAGTVERVGPDTTGFTEGERVFGQFMDVAHGRGSFAEYAVVGAGKLAPIPEAISFDAAAALPTAGSAGHDFVEETGIGPGQTLFINGASGAVGQAAVQLAVAKGARVVATTSPAAADYMRELGASVLIDYTAAPTVGQVRAACPEGVDAIIDVITLPGELEEILGLLKDGGIVVSSNGAVDRDELEDRGLRGTNAFANATPRTLSFLSESVADGDLKIRIAETTPLAEAPAALERLKNGEVNGKIILSI